MVVQHNLRAMNSNRMLGITTGQQSKSSEKLSSGYKINRAADDAAGLTISEKMRKQIKGLDQASTNGQDGVSAVQTAEGALTEVHSMLQRMNELAVQASNGTNSEGDREAIQAEIEQLTTEIDRVAETTKFNETYLLKGNTAGAETDKKVNAHDAGLKGILTDKGNIAEFELKKALEKGDKVTIAGKEYTIGDKAAATKDGYALYKDVEGELVKAGDTIKKTNGDVYTLVDKVAVAGTWEDGTKFTITDEKGNVKEYTVAGATDLAAGTIANTDAEALIKENLKNPAHKVVVTEYKPQGAAAAVKGNFEVVSSLGANELSMGNFVGKTVNDVVTGATGTGMNAAATDIAEVTLGGNKTIITAHKPVSAADIADVVGSMKAGDEFQLTSASGAQAGTPMDVKIADKTDATKGEYTREDALALINIEKDDMDIIEFKIQTSNKDGVKMLGDKGITNSATFGQVNNKVTVVGGSPLAVTKTENGENLLTISEAYTKMAEELKKASSIGADTEAKVTDLGNGKFTIEKGSVKATDSLSFSLHVGADADMTNKISVGIETMSAANLGIKGLNVADDTGVAATYAIDAIADAVSKVSAQRSALGAVQNRLEHTIANLDNVVENTTAAESRIRDTDMAEEMVEYSKNNILAQAGQSMLAQANQATQGVLSLLQ